MKKLTKIAALLAACLMLFTACSTEDSGSQSTGADTASSDASTQSSEDSSSKTESSEAQESSASETPAETVGTEFYDDAVFIGDSVSLRLYYYCQGHSGALGKAQFLTSGNLGSGNALDKITEDSVHPVYQGEKMLIEDGVKASGAKKVFIMLGMNDIGLYGIEDSVKNMQTLIDRILEKSPDAEIYLQSMTPMLESTQLKNLNNENIEKYNAELKKLAEEKGYHFADVASVMKDENGNLIPEYCSDPEDMGIHFTDAGAEAWIDYLLKNASSF